MIDTLVHLATRRRAKERGDTRPEDPVVSMNLLGGGTVLLELDEATQAEDGNLEVDGGAWIAGNAVPIEEVR